MNKRPVQEQISMIVSSFMAILYVGGGIVLITSSSSFAFLHPGSIERYLLAAILIIYGIYRARRAWKIYKYND
ncbi:MAG: hypothetical protein WCY86_14295 [Spirosomataceae bacterium]